MRNTITLLLTAILYVSCGPQPKHTCGVVVSKFQTGKFNDEFKVAVLTDDGERCVGELRMMKWAHIKLGDRFCGLISNPQDQ